MCSKWMSVLFVLVIMPVIALAYLSRVQAQENTFVSAGQAQLAPARPAPVAGGQQTGPTLQIGAAVTATAGSVITAPLTFVGAGVAVNAISFSLDLDQACLALDLRDQNGDGQPDALRFYAPPTFQVIASTDLTDEDGEVDIIIADLFPPFTVLPDRAPLVTLRLSAVCQPEAGATKRGAIRFADDPTPSFGGLNGESLQGTAIDGWVTIVGPPAPATPTPTLTPVPLPTLTATAPTSTPTLPPTAQPTQTPLTRVEFFTATPVGAAFRLDWRTTSEVDSAGFYLYRKQVDGQGGNGGFQVIGGLIPSQGAQGGDYHLLDPSVQANTRYLYLLVEKKRNGALTEFTELLIVTINNPPYQGLLHQVLLPLIVR